MTRLATFFLMCSDDGLAIFFAQAFPILVIACVGLYRRVVDAAAVETTFTSATAATVTPTVASTVPNVENLLGQLILWNLGYIGCEVFSYL